MLDLAETYTRCVVPYLSQNILENDELSVEVRFAFISVIGTNVTEERVKSAIDNALRVAAELE